MNSLLSTSAYSIVAFVLVLGVLVFVHELGHFLVAKAFGVRVLKFSLGFGKVLFSRTRGETEYLLCAVPLGGYVKMYGEDGEQEVSLAEQGRSFSHKPVWQRFCVVLAGPMSNLLFAVLLYFALFSIAGIPELVDRPELGGVMQGSAAEKAGLREGDMVRAINGQEVRTWADIVQIVSACDGKPVTFIVQRQKEDLQFSVQPVLEEDKNLFGEITGKRYMVGIKRVNETWLRKVSVLEAGQSAIINSVMAGKLIVEVVVKMVQQIIPADQIGGPILIAEVAGDQLQSGWVELFSFMALLSVNLGILNLLPIPVLDGGHLMLFALEGVRGKALGERAMLVLQQLGLVLLTLLMVFAFANDIIRLVQRWIAP